MKKILIVSQYFYPEKFRINDLAFELKKRGYYIEVVTGIPNYPAGKFYKGYSMFRNNTKYYQGIKVNRLFLIPRFNNTFMLAMNYFSFIVSSFFEGLKYFSNWV